jgi:predicted phage-related endonuclease
MKGRYKPMKKTTNINEVIKEIKEYQAMQDELKRQIEALKAEAVEYLESNEIDEYICEEGKVTYREVISNRLDTTALKKSEWSEVYDMFIKQTSNMRFTCN